MGNLCTFILTVVLFAGVFFRADAEGRVMLRDNWALASSADLDASGETLSRVSFEPEQWYRTSVPKTVLAALVENEVYPDPYYGENLKAIPGYRDGLWLAMPKDSPFRASWWYRTEFDLPAHFAGQYLVLHLDGINYCANVWLNGKQLADRDAVIGMFRRFEFDVTGTARIGEKNCLAVEVFAPGDLAEGKHRGKQVEATTGWDDHNPQPPDMNMGLWQDVYVTATGPVALRHPYAASELELPSLSMAHLTVSAHLLNKTAEPVTGTLVAKIEDIVCAQEVALAPNETKVVTFAPDAYDQLNVANPRVWWPVDVGRQELYALELEFLVDGQVSDTAHTRFGIRDATTYINDEGWRGYTINGRNILIRGGAWMTSDMLLRLSHKRYDALIRYAREAHLNMLRSEGFSIRETGDFYDLCDEYGVMVTQQIFGRSILDEDLAIACVADMMLRIRNHPSLVHFLGHDETFPTKRLNTAYQELIAQHRVNRTYQPHSGAFDLKDRFKTGGTRTGSLQVWTYATPSHYYTSEDTGAWGFAQSGGIGGIFATLETMQRMMPEDALWPPFSDAWSFHTVTQGGYYFSPVLKAIHDRFGKPEDIRDFLRKGQVLNYESARGMFEAYGRNKYAATGITTWKYDAAWPASPTWQYVDWYLNATAAYYGAKKACEPLHVQYAYDDHSIYVVNSFYKEFNGLKVTADVYNLDMTRKYSSTTTVDVAADGKARAFTIQWPDGLTKCHFLHLTLKDAEGKAVADNLYWLSTVPDVPNPLAESFLKPVSIADYTDLNGLPRVELQASAAMTREGAECVAHVTLKNPGGQLAFFIDLAVAKDEAAPAVAPAFWDDNYLSLLPGEQKEVSARFAAADVEDGTPVVKVSGWNIAPKTVQIAR